MRPRSRSKRVMSGLKKKEDDSLDDVNSLIDMIKGTKKSEGTKKPEETGDKPQTSSPSKPAKDTPATQDIVFSDADDIKAKSPGQGTPPAGASKEITGKDVRESLGKLLANEETNQAHPPSKKKKPKRSRKLRLSMKIPRQQYVQNW